MNGTDAFDPTEGGTDEEATRGGIRRRSVVLGAAWSVPVIATAIAAPLAAASTCNGRAVVTSAGYIRDSTDGWYGQILSNATGAELGIGAILPESRMKSVIQFSNPTDCRFQGTVRIQIDLPVRTIAGGPTSEQGWAYADGGTYTRDGLTYRRYLFVGDLSIGPNTTWSAGINWTLADQATLRTYLGAQDGPQRWSMIAETSGSMGWRLPNPPGTVVIDGVTAHTGGYNNTLPQNAGYWIHSHTVQR